MASCPVTASSDPTVPFLLFLQALSSVPASHYLIALSLLLLLSLYRFLEFHSLRDALRFFRGDRVLLTFNPASEIYRGVASKCRILHSRYLATPWLASPHLQTTFLNFFGNPPVVCYRRQLFTLRDGGTIALDWLPASDVAGRSFDTNWAISKDDSTPLVMVIPGLTSDSASSYLKHLAHGMAKQGWNVVISNHRGLGGVSVTSDCFYSAGWTEDLREVAKYLHQEYAKAPLFAIGTSIGANILVKYLGEEGENTPLAGAASICSPWDLVIGDRFINRRLQQRIYDIALAIGLKGYAKLHQSAFTRLANWDGISKSFSIRDYDNHATCIVGKFETVDTYYRWCSSASFVGGVSIPLLCISVLDDPLCTREAIPWDECRTNKNVVLATVAHGGHLACFKGITGRSLWWVGAVAEFLSVLRASPFMHKQKQIRNTGMHYPLDCSIDKTPYVNITEDGMIAAVRNTADHNEEETASASSNVFPVKEQTDPSNDVPVMEQNEHRSQVNTALTGNDPSSEKNTHDDKLAKVFNDMTVPVKRSIKRISRHSGRSVWLLAYIAIITTWPLVGSALAFFYRRKLQAVRLAEGIKR